MDFNTAMAVAAKAEADGDDVAADSMRAAIREQDANIKAAAEHNSEHEDWLRKIDVPYINACTDVEELHKISQHMEKEGFAGLKKAADERLRDYVKCAALRFSNSVHGMRLSATAPARVSVTAASSGLVQQRSRRRQALN